MKLSSTHTLYRQADATCSAPQQVLMLLDAAGRHTRDAAAHLRARRWAEKGAAVEAALACLAALRNTLDLSAGESALTIGRMYDFLMTKLTMGNVSRDAAQFDQVADSIQELRNAWQQLFARLRTEGRLDVEETASSGQEALERGIKVAQ